MRGWRWDYCGRCNRMAVIKGTVCASCADTLRDEAEADARKKEARRG